MPRSTRANGRPGTQVIPTGWGRSHAGVAQGTMPSRVALRLPGTTGVWNESTKRTDITPLDPFAANVRARIQALTESRTGNKSAVDVVDDQIRVTGYMVAIPRDLRDADQLAVGVLVDVVKTDDPLLAGLTLRVTDVVVGTNRFERDLLCTLNT